MIRSSGKRKAPISEGFVQRMKRNGQEVRTTKSGHSYAILRAVKQPRLTNET